MLSVDFWVVSSFFCVGIAASILVVVVFPAAVWQVREIAVAALINFCSLYPHRMKESGFRLLELRALLYEGAGFRERVANRLSKLRELYLALDQRGREPRFSEAEAIRYGKRCLLELVRIVDGEVRSLKLSNRVDGSIVYTKDILRFIANQQQAFLRETRVETTADIEMYFRRKPMTLEQMATLLEAVCYGLLYRREGPTELSDDQLDILSEIIRHEQRLRLLVEERIFGNGVGEEEVLRVVGSLLGEDVEEWIEARLGRKRGEVGHQEEVGGHRVLQFLYMDQLKQLIQKKYERFKGVLPEKRRVNEVFDMVVPARNDLAHGRRVGSAEFALAQAGLLEIDAWIERAKRTDSSG